MLVDQNPGRAAILEQALSDQGYTVVARITDGRDLQERVEQARPDVIIIDLESPDRDTLEHVAGLNRHNPRPVLMFAEESDAQTITAALQAGVSAYVVDGFSKQRLRPIMEVAIARFREYQALRQELQQVRSELADRKDVERAKGILMKRKGISEDQAYRHLRKLAMDRNMKIGEVARNLIAVVDLLD